MFGRIFGRGKDDQDQAVCADCGRTLLAGEWTQTVVGDDGRELLICSLCGQADARSGGDALSAGAVAANSGRVRETRSDAPPAQPAPRAAEPPARDQRAESDAFWLALKDKDADIERLQAQLARAEAERQELAGRFARLDAEAPRPVTETAEPPSALTGDSSEPGERTWGETPAEFAAEMAALREAEAAPTPEPAAAAVATPPAFEPDLAEQPPVAAASPPAEEPANTPAAAEEPAETPAPAEQPTDAEAPPATVFDDTQPIPAIDGDMLADADARADDASTGEIAASEAAAAMAVEGLDGAPAAPASDAPPAVVSAADAEAAATSLTLLQRGVDLLNVSRVPRKIAETNEQLGLPHVHVGCDGQTVAVTFLWTMGWYRFHVDFDSGDVMMDDRGYEERTDLRPNAGVRADGTVQLAPAQISRAAAQRAQAGPEASDEVVASAPPEVPAAGQSPAASAPPTTPESPSVAAQKPPEILSKSLLGQRSDDESASWEQTKARDFDWDH